MDQLDDGSQAVADRAVVPAHLRRQQQQSGPDALASAVLDVVSDLVDQLDVGVRLPRKLSLHLRQTGFDELEDLLWSHAALIPRFALLLRSRRWIRWQNARSEPRHRSARTGSYHRF